MLTIIDGIFSLYEERGSAEYGGESVSQLEHALQCATLAERSGATPALICAALFHDIGHLLETGERRAIEMGEDARHEVVAAGYLGRWFGGEVTHPVRSHVDAKRYLTATEPGYFDSLSPASVRSLAVQGGPMNTQAAAVFIAQPFGHDAVDLRCWDDLAKVVGGRTPRLEHFREYVEACISHGAVEMRESA